jgi:hypothetical protein
MSPVRAPYLTIAFALTALLATATACDDDDPVDPDGDVTIVGTWQATSFTALGTDFIAGGMTLSATLSASDTYTFVVTADAVGICGDDGPDCSESGAFTSTETHLTVDPGEDDEVTFAYDIQGTNMTWTGSIEGTPAVVTWVRVS